MKISQQTAQAAHRAGREARPWVVALARFGFASIGVVYLVVGVLALQAATGSGGKTTDSTGALHTIAAQPFGRVMLGLMAVGLLGYALWRVVQALTDPDNKGDDAKGFATRAGYVMSGLIYGALAFTAISIISGASRGGNSQPSGAAQILSAPFGRTLMVLIGLGIIGAALWSFYQAATAKFREKLDSAQMSAKVQSAVEKLGRAGFAARGVVLTLTGWFFVRAGLDASAAKSGGLDKALQTIAQSSNGPLLLGIVAVGVTAYGLYQLALARYRRIYL